MATGEHEGAREADADPPAAPGIIGALRARVGARMAALRAELAPVLRAELAARAHARLAPRTAALDAARAEADAVRAALIPAERRVAAALARLDRAPFTAATTVHAAHARDPGVGRIFAAHGLPRCPDCAVGADETLAEAASGEGLALAALLEELNALLPVFHPAAKPPSR